jgi:ribosome-binding ATPase YchF (GTP1/OBG family)
VAILEKCQAALNEGQASAQPSTSAKKSCRLLKQFFLITAKPAMFVANVAEDGFENNPLARQTEGLRRGAKRARGGHLRQDRSRNVAR